MSKHVSITCEDVIAHDLEPGDFFSIRGNDYWEDIDDKDSIGEKVWLRTNTPAIAADDEGEPIFKLHITVKEGE